MKEWDVLLITLEPAYQIIPYVTRSVQRPIVQYVYHTLKHRSTSLTSGEVLLDLTAPKVWLFPRRDREHTQLAQQ